MPGFFSPTARKGKEARMATTVDVSRTPLPVHVHAGDRPGDCACDPSRNPKKANTPPAR
jgi:hypothetical protein